MTEACVKTLKRDYVYVHDCPDAKIVLSQLAAGSSTIMTVRKAL